MLPVWAVPCPPSGWFVKLQGIFQYQVIKGCKLWKSETSISPVCLCIPFNFSTPIPFYNQTVLLRCLVNDSPELPIEVVNLIVIISRCWCIDLYDGYIEGAALKRIEISLLETGRQPKTALTMSLCARKPTSSPLKYTLCPSSEDISPKFFQCISPSPVC